MLRTKNLQKYLSTFFSAVYLFVALFSQNFHQHESGFIFKDFHFKKSEKTFTSDYSVETATDCLSCHILHVGNSLVPEDFQFTFTQSEHFLNQRFAYQQRFANCEQLFISLRGPPSNFI